MEKKTKIRKTELYSHWIAMKGRCLCKKQPYYKNYGGRGIKVCDEWLHNSLSFFEWSYKNGYIEDAGLTLDRIDVNGNYEPSNCRWVSRKTQCNNKRNNHYITYKGRTQTLAQWCEELNLNYGTIKSRINRDHWTVEKAFETKDNARLKLITYKGKTQHLAEWCRELNLKYKKIQARLNESHWSVERAFEE